MKSLGFFHADPGFTLTVDNVDCSTLATHQPLSKNQTFHWTLGFATKNRLSFRDLAEQPTTTGKVITNILNTLKYVVIVIKVI